MKKVYIYEHDPMMTFFYTKEECIDMFGQEFVDDDDCMTEIPDELYERFLKVEKEFSEVSNELEKIRRGY